MPRYFGFHAQRLDKLQAAAGPHAVAVVSRRQEPAPRRMAIVAQPCVVDRLLEECPMPEQGQGVTWRRRRLVQCRGNTLDQVMGDAVVAGFATADPGTEVMCCHCLCVLGKAAPQSPDCGAGKGVK
ncbi:hypothetical protein D3C78_1443320 [compost metagenome]